MGLVHEREYFYDKPILGEDRSPRWFACLIRGIAFVVFKVAFRYRFEGRENLELDDGGPAVIAGNHSSMADPLFIILAFPKGNCRFIAKEELFAPAANAFIAQGLARLGAFPIRRNTADRIAIKRAVACLKRGENIGIFPEGTRVKDGDGESHEHFGGAVLIANMAKRPIIPVGIEGTDHIKPPGSHLLHFPTVTIRFGKPVYPHDFDDRPKAERTSACIEEVMHRCYLLRNEPLGDESPGNETPRDEEGR